MILYISNISTLTPYLLKFQQLKPLLPALVPGMEPSTFHQTDPHNSPTRGPTLSSAE